MQGIWGSIPPPLQGHTNIRLIDMVYTNVDERTATHYRAHCHTLLHTAAHGRAHCRSQLRALPHSAALPHTTALPHTAALPHCRRHTAIHCHNYQAHCCTPPRALHALKRAHCHTLPLALPHSAAPPHFAALLHTNTLLDSRTIHMNA
jgi:hypothetical protein